MSRKELGRLEIMGRVKAGTLRLRQAAQLLEVSYRQVKRIWGRYQQQGAAGLVHQSVGRQSNHGRPAVERRRVLALIREKYGGDSATRFGPTLVTEHLASEDGIALDPTTVRRWMVADGLWSRARRRRPYRQRRERKAHFGELVQLDGSAHAWLETRGPAAYLMSLVDDATSRTLLQFTPQETIWAAAHLLRRWIEAHGIPQALYTDWKNVYVRRPNAAERAAGIAPLTQFGRMCHRLGIRIIPASSPQAKGRIERSHGTHQDRLVKKLRRAATTTYDAANAFLAAGYVTEHNARFARPPAGRADFHRRAPTARVLDGIFQLEQARVLSNDWVVRYANRLFQLERQSNRPPARARVTVREAPDGQIDIRYRDRRMQWTELTGTTGAAPSRSADAPIAARSVDRPAGTIRTRAPQPRPDHPWRRSFTEGAQPIWRVADQ